MQQPNITTVLEHGGGLVLQLQVRVGALEALEAKADAEIAKHFAAAKARFEGGPTWRRYATLVNNLAETERGIADVGNRIATLKGRLSAALGAGEDAGRVEAELAKATAEQAKLAERRQVAESAIAEAKAAAEAEWSQTMEETRQRVEAEAVAAQAAVAAKVAKALAGLADEAALAHVRRDLLVTPGSLVVRKHTGVPPAFRRCPRSVAVTA